MLAFQRNTNLSVNMCYPSENLFLVCYLFLMMHFCLEFYSSIFVFIFFVFNFFSTRFIFPIFESKIWFIRKVVKHWTQKNDEKSTNHIGLETLIKNTFHIIKNLEKIETYVKSNNNYLKSQEDLNENIVICTIINDRLCWCCAISANLTVVLMECSTSWSYEEELAYVLTRVDRGESNTLFNGWNLAKPNHNKND